jgi:hypothetical protein
MSIQEEAGNLQGMRLPGRSSIAKDHGARSPFVATAAVFTRSQATTLVIRAMALGEVTARDWWKVIRREFSVGLALGIFLAAIGSMRILLWQELFGSYGEHYVLIAMTVSLSLVGVVLWGRWRVRRFLLSCVSSSWILPALPRLLSRPSSMLQG